LAKKIKTHQDGSLVVRTTEAEFDRPVVGDVRIEEGIARVDGEVMSAQVLHRPTGRRMTAAPHTVGPDFELMRPEQRGHKVYKFVERPASGPDGLYHHLDNTDWPDPTTDDEGFIVDFLGKRIARYVKPLYDRDGNLQYTDGTKQRIKCEPDPHYWALVEEHDSEDKALKAAEKHL
jgi:hypothetical protein